MKEKKNPADDVNLMSKSLIDFVHYYNKNVPEVFPRASVKALEKFQVTYPALFGTSKEWTIDKHRKKLMDWLVSYKELV